MTAACQFLANGRLILLPNAPVERKIRAAFERSASVGLLALATDALEDESLPSDLGFWREFARQFLTRLCQTPPDREGDGWLSLAPPSEAELRERVLAAPPFPGLENLNAKRLIDLWNELDAHVRSEVESEGTDLESWVHARQPLWRSVGRVTFHLAENRRSEAYPFAFLATYTHRISARAKLQYLPLGNAVQRYARANDQEVLQTLLTPVREAARTSSLARELLESRRVFQVLAWSPAEAYRFIEDAERFEEAGLIVKVPDWWNGGRPPRPCVQVNLDTRESTSVGLDAMLRFDVRLALEREPLSAEEWERIRAAEGGLISIKGRWVEVDPQRLAQVRDHWERAERAAASGALSFLDGMRLLAGFRSVNRSPGDPTGASSLEDGAWTSIETSGRLREQMRSLFDPRLLREDVLVGSELRANLRPYQQTGLNWLWLTHTLRLGACLADDMGLGKTIQVIALLLAIRQRNRQAATKGREAASPDLLVVPASLLGNWRREIETFAPALRVFPAHPSQTGSLESLPPLSEYDAVLTTYGMLSRLPELLETPWNLVVLDEAQAIKNPASRQSRAVKSLTATHRLALTGTPIENNVTDLWSLFDFLNPGLLGSARQFSAAMNELARNPADGFRPLRKLVAPYILRRLKSDPSVLSDLPDKTEMPSYCGLARPQALLYQRSIRELAARLRELRGNSDSIERNGLVLTYLMRFKQICNHPALWTGSGNFDPQSSGKFKRLAELAGVMRERGEKVLVFSQFREMGGPLSESLETIFGRPGLSLHGGTPVKRRQELVERFQEPAGPPFFVISLKAGGTGLNLTAATHVIHFDRWWNPAVEDQATDRAYRIGQRNKVLVHKFICPGTVEERIDRLIAEKRDLAGDLIGDSAGAELLLTRMEDDELLEFVTLDLESARI